MNKLKNSIPLLLTLALITATVNLSPVYASPTGLQVLDAIDGDASIVHSEYIPGASFTVNVYVDDVEHLFGFEFKLVYLPTIVNVLSVDKITLGEEWYPSGGGFGGPSTIGPAPGGPSIVWYKEVNNELGYVWYAVTLGTDSPNYATGLSGSGTLATIEFTVNGEGGTILDLVETDLRNPQAEEIPHEVSYATYTNVPGAPTASFTADPTTLEIKQKVRFDASASYDPDGYIVSYYWEFGDGTNETSVDHSGRPTPMTDHAYSNPGKYRVKLTVTDNSSAQSMATAPITVNPPSTPNAKITEAEPEFRNIKLSGKEYGINFFSMNNFIVYVQNLANGPTYVYVSFTITRDGDFVYYFETAPFTFAEGTYEVVHKFNTQYEDPEQYETNEVIGEYIVKAQVWYSSDGYTYFQGNIKSFKFKVTP